MSEHIKTIFFGINKQIPKDFTENCGECQASCQSACKTSCTVGNQKCLAKVKKEKF